MPCHRIADPVVCNRPEWQALLEIAIAAGSHHPLKGITPEGLSPDGYWEYRKRSKYGRVYLVWNVRTEKGKKVVVIGSVHAEHVDAGMWKPSPNSERQFNFDTGPVVVKYDHQALPERIDPLRML